MIAVLTALAVTLPPASALDIVTYPSLVEIVKVEAKPVAGGRGRYKLEVTFNLIPEVPRGAKVEFELQRDGFAVGDSFAYVLETEVRKNLRTTFTPKSRLVTDKYYFMTTLPLDQQSAEVRRAVEAKPARFPPEHKPWPMNHPQQAIPIGTAEDEAAEKKEVADFVSGNMEKLLDLNEKAMDELEKQGAGKLDQAALKKFLEQWMKDVTQVQKDVKAFEEKEPGLHFKCQKVYEELVALSKMVAKRITKNEVPALLKKNNVLPASFKLPVVADFDANYRFRANASDIEERCQKIDALLDPESAPEASAAAEAEAGKAKDGEAAPGSEKNPAAEGGAGEGKTPKKDEGKKSDKKAEGASGSPDDKGKKPKAPKSGKGEKSK